MGTLLLLNCAALPHSLSPRNFQTHIQKKHSNQLSTSSSSSQCYTGLAALSSPRLDAQEGSPHKYHKYGWGSQPGRLCPPLCAVLAAAEPIQGRNYTSANQPRSTLSLPKHSSWPAAAQSDHCTDCNTGNGVALSVLRVSRCIPLP